MAAMSPVPLDDDHLLTHHYIRLFGRRPTAAQLAQYRAARSRAELRLVAQLRRWVATLVTRW